MFVDARSFRPTSPGSDDGSAVQNAGPSSFPSQPSLSFQSTSTAAPLLCQPVGFSWNAPSATPAHTYNAPPAPTTTFLPGQAVPALTQAAQVSRKKSAKGKEKETSVKTTVSRKSKDKAPEVSSPHAGGIAPAPLAASSSTGFGCAPTGQTAFRVRSYVNDPSAVGAPPPPAKGPYTSDYRATSATSSAPAGMHKASTGHGEGPSAPAQPTCSSYYRHDYEKQRDGAPARRAAPAKLDANTFNASTAPASVHTPTYTNIHTPAYVSPHTPAPAYNSHRTPDSTYTNSHTLHSVSNANLRTAPMPEPPSFDQPDSYADTYSVAMRAQPSSGHHGGSPKRRHHSHKGSTSYRSEPAPYATPAAPPAPAQMPPARVLRTLTLLIEDARSGASLLAELRVPLKPADSAEDGFWADAKEVSDELQSGPSRIDGRAKVYTMRGKYRQYFLRVTPENGNDCTSANLRVSRERTIEIFVEDNPLPGGIKSEYQYSPPRFERELLTPVTDTMASPSPAPMVAPRPLMSFRTDNFHEHRADDYGDAQPYNPRKRRRSNSSRSSTSEAFGAQQIQHQHPPYQYYHSSPYSQESPVSRTSPLPQHSPMSRQSPLPSSPPRSSPAPSQRFSSSHMPSAFDQPHYSHHEQPFSHGESPYLPGPSPSKKSKYSTVDSREESPRERLGYAWSHSRTSSIEDEPPAVPTSAMSTSLHQSGNVFSLPTPQSDSGGTPSSQENASLPSVAPASPDISQPELDNNVGMYLRSIFCKEPAWDKFVEGRKRVLRMSEQLEQYRYVKSKFDEYTQRCTPTDLEGAPSVKINRTQVMRAFNLPLSWGEDGLETLALTAMYGPGGKRCEDPRVLTMLEEVPPISTGMQVKKYLALLREIHSRWTIDHPEM
ncbi:hypothetical protein AcV5_007317 [Taiwanofungus camphoratus]|nr:hypothetical protein AcV5_007317 [Antrodia cinnamomea]